MLKTIGTTFLILGIFLFSTSALQISGTLAVSPSVIPCHFPDAVYAPASGTWLVVWQQGDLTGDENNQGGKAVDIYGARISQSGTLLDPTGFVICEAADFQARPAVATNGTDFMVTWHDMRNHKDWDLYAARVSAAGTVLDPGGFVVSATPDYNQCFPDIVYGGGHYYIAWLDARFWPEYRLFGARVSTDGAVMDASGIELTRMMTDADMKEWEAKPYAPGKKGAGWHEIVTQPAIPTITCNDSIILLTSKKETYENDYPPWKLSEYFTITINPQTGLPTGDRAECPLEAGLYGTGNGYSVLNARLAHASIGRNGKIVSTNFAMADGFGTSGAGLWNISLFSPAGNTISLVNNVDDDSVQSICGYRSGGARPNMTAIAVSGDYVLAIRDRFLHTNGLGGNMDIVGLVLDTNGVKQAPMFTIAGRANIQSCPVVSGGAGGVFLAVWQEESDTMDPCIKASLVTP